MLVLEQGARGEWKQFEQKPKAPLEADDKPFFQLIKTKSSNVIGGVCRKFLGLKPGHTYRLWTRMNTFEMEKVSENWSFSFHAVPHAKLVSLIAEQMAGTDKCPATIAERLARAAIAFEQRLTALESSLGYAGRAR